MDGDFSSVKPKRLSDSAVDQVLGLIRSGRLPAGTRLPSERKLVELLGVSRNSLREAVRILETMGLLRVVPGRGTWVRDDASLASLSPPSGWLSVNSQDMIDLLEMRETLEVKAAALAAERGTTGELDQVFRAMELLSQAIRDGDEEQVIRADTDFHRWLATASGNRILAESLDTLSPLCEETRRALLSLPGRLRRMESEHRAICEAVLNRRPEEAARMMLKHVVGVETEVGAALYRDRYLSQATP